QLPPVKQPCARKPAAYRRSYPALARHPVVLRFPCEPPWKSVIIPRHWPASTMRAVAGFLERIAGTIERHAMLARGQRVGVAVSGGADSVCLLQVLSELAPRWNLQLTVLHLNHGLRGEESRQDADFVRALAALRGLPVRVRELDLTAASGNLEEASREARLSFFHEMIAGGVVDLVAVGHTRSDQAETVLFRFLRGSGAGGLAGI